MSVPLVQLDRMLARVVEFRLVVPRDLAAVHGEAAGSRGGRQPAFDRDVHKRRNVAERCFNGVKQWSGIATCHDKTAESFQAAVTLVSPLMWA
ncbi:hypothetical protein ACFXGT_31875 [Streptomyces sp. NPDC059352]|uniref:hypothetical protein n=1 Tax=Streptomyces sp. NPDC059352 TaxID=3346810 RepID=UPI0036C27A0A